MLCFSAGVNGVFPGITFSANAVTFTPERLLLSRELKKSNDETAVQRRFFGLRTTVYRCALQHDAGGKTARLVPHSLQKSSPKALILLDVPAEYVSSGPSRFEVVGGSGSEFILTKYGHQYLGSSYGDFFYLVALALGASITLREKATDRKPATDVYTITFDGEEAIHTIHEQPVECAG